jgi:N-acyl-D-amino-acid deacylase
MDSFLKRQIPRFDWLRKFKKDEFIRRLKTKEFRARLRRLYDSGSLEFHPVHPKVDPFWMNCFTIVSCENNEYEGRVFGDIVREKNADPLDVLFDVLIEDPEVTWYLSLDRRYAPEAIPEFIKHPQASPCTDTFVYSAEPTGTEVFGDPPLSTYGTFPQYIGYYVRETKVLSLEEAVRKATSLPAQIIGLKDRGIIKSGAFADIVVFDLGTIKMKGNNPNPAQPPEGIEYVLVNGKVVYRDMNHTGEKSGKVLRRE